MNVGKMMLLMFVLFLPNCGVKAQTVSLSPEQCGHTIQYGEPIFCMANDSASEYEFKFFTRRDTVVINSSRNYLSVDKYRQI